MAGCQQAVGCSGPERQLSKQATPCFARHLPPGCRVLVEEHEGARCQGGSSRSGQGAEREVMQGVVERGGAQAGAGEGEEQGRVAEGGADGCCVVETGGGVKEVKHCRGGGRMTGGGKAHQAGRNIGGTTVACQHKPEAA